MQLTVPGFTGNPILDLCILIGIVGAGATGLFAIARLLRAIGRFLAWFVRCGRKANELLDDLLGTPERPGVMKRLANIESGMVTEEGVPLVVEIRELKGRMNDAEATVYQLRADAGGDGERGASWRREAG